MKVNKIIVAIALITASMSVSAISVVTQPTRQPITSCAVKVDDYAKTYIVSASESRVYGYKQCNISLTEIPTGHHVVKVAFIEDNPIFGRVNSPYSAIEFDVSDSQELTAPVIGTTGL